MPDVIWHLTGLIGEALFVIGITVPTCMVMEAYHGRRAQEEVGEHDKVKS